MAGMSDAELRGQARQAAAGDLDASVLLLRQRVRAGVVAPWQIERAAYLGCPASRQIEDWPVDVDQGAPVTVASTDPCLHVRGALVCLYCAELDEWLRGMQLAGLTMMARVAVAASRAAWFEHHRGVVLWSPRGPVCERGLECLAIRAAIEAAEAWAVAPNEINLHRWDAAWVVTNRMGLGWVAPVWEGVVWIVAAGEQVGQDRVRQAIAAELVPWVLGEADLLRRRVELRRRKTERSRDG